ncbi:MAG: methionine synthase [Micrococcales bacterium]|nr:MAG: methionine synthase [Micrococcales bacterium]PIE27553.1 MAG: methionine synthase [Micrococcales bacterium]
MAANCDNGDPVDALAGRTASGIGSWPGTDALEAARFVIGELGREPGVPFLPELPARGPGADMVGRAAAMLVGLHVDLQPSGWRLVSHPGRDEQRAQAWWRHDLDALAEAAHGYQGPLKAAVTGAWTLLSHVNLERGERAVSDPGAQRDIVESLAEGIATMLADITRAVPGASLIVQLDEPSLPAVLAGRLTTQSGIGKLRPVPPAQAQAGLTTLADAARDAGAVHVLAHCCAATAPVGLLREAGLDGISLDLATLGPASWESVAASVESGVRLWAGIDPTRQRIDQTPLPQWWQRLGLPRHALNEVFLTPACGLANSATAQAAAAVGRLLTLAGQLHELSTE